MAVRLPISFGPAGGFTLKHKVMVVWGGLFLNVLAPSPGALRQLIAQLALVVALLMAIRLNPRLTVRPTILLVMFGIIAIVAVMTSVHNEFWMGSTYRAARYAVFVLVLWLLTPLWGRKDHLLLEAHVAVLKVVVASVAVGFMLSPGAAMATGRLNGVIWPIPATQVAHYAAVLVGVILIQRLLVMTPVRQTLTWSVVCAAILIGTHTRTALIGLSVGLGFAAASLFLGYARVRRMSAVVLIAGISVVIVFGPLIGTWLMRGQSTEQAASLTGRTLVWEQLLSADRGFLETLLGSGMSNASFGGLPIDSSWVATIYDSGFLGVTLQVIAVLALLATAIVRPRGYARAIALFFVVYAIVASVTETALNAPSTYLLDLAVAASLLALPWTPTTLPGSVEGPTTIDATKEKTVRHRTAPKRLRALQVRVVR